MARIDHTMLARLQKAADDYRQAYDVVERTLRQADHPDLPTWVFNLERFNVEALKAMSPDVARAEARRRACRRALHAVAELTALDDQVGALAAEPTMELPDVGTAEGMTRWAEGVADKTDADRWTNAIDRFIGIVSYADEGGCVYLNGTFEPVDTHDDPGEDVTMVMDRGD
jgi:hypothetical protein